MAALALALALQPLTGCAGLPGDVGAGQRHPDAAPAQNRPTHLADQEAEAHRLVNRHRASRGLPPLSHDSRIADIARAHSRAMASRARRFGHDEFEARSAEIQRHLSIRTVAENVAYDSREPPADAVVQGWLGSPGHRANIEGSFSVTGIGAARAADGTAYFTQIFVATR